MESLAAAKSWTEADTEATLKAASIHGCDAVVVDYHEAGTTYLASLRDGGLYVIARDDLALYSFPCQMVFNGNADATRLPYCSSSGDTSFLLGWSDEACTSPLMMLNSEAPVIEKVEVSITETGSRRASCQAGSLREDAARGLLGARRCFR